jgi:hypothetical protein
MNGQLMAVLHEYSLLSRLFEFVQFQESPKVQCVVVIGPLFGASVTGLLWHRKSNSGVLFGFLLIAVIPSASSPRMRVEADA